MAKKKKKDFGAFVTRNLGRDKKTGKVIQEIFPIATTAVSKKQALEQINKRVKSLKRKRITKTFTIKPFGIKNKKIFIKIADKAVKRHIGKK